MHACVCVCVRVCMYLCVCVCVFVRVCIVLASVLFLLKHALRFANLAWLFWHISAAAVAALIA